MALEGTSPKTVGAVRNKLEKTWPFFGDAPARSVTSAQLLEVCKQIEAKGNYETAQRLRSSASRVCRYAITQGKIEHDISVGLKGALIQPRSGGFPAITEEAELAPLLRAVWGCHGAFVTLAGLKLTAMTWLRSAELRGGRWEEIDWEKRLWTIPAERMKLRRKHHVPLSGQAMEVLRQLQSLVAHKSQLILPSADGKAGRPMSENTLRNALNALGYKGIHVPHGCRKTASTNMNELEWDERWIEKQLAHEDRNRVRRVYNSAEYLEDRARMMQAYSDWLDRVRG